MKIKQKSVFQHCGSIYSSPLISFYKDNGFQISFAILQFSASLLDDRYMYRRCSCMRPSLCTFYSQYCEDNWVFTEKRWRMWLCLLSPFNQAACSLIRGVLGLQYFFGGEHKASLNSVHKAVQICTTWQHYWLNLWDGTFKREETY